MKPAAWLLIGLGLTLPSPGSAQRSGEQPEARPESAAGSRRVAIEEIVVTAQKREENVQDVPISINVFSGAELEARGVLDPKDLQQTTPGLVYDELAGFSIIYLRGVGTDGFLPGGDLSVANYVRAKRSACSKAVAFRGRELRGSWGETQPSSSDSPTEAAFAAGPRGG